jgi:AcrR family transcriptional regulator
MVELLAEHSYDAVAVTTLASRARISKRDFYKHFGGKEECFLSTYDSIVTQSLRGILAAVEGEEEWRERLRGGFLAFAGQIARSPAAARLTLVEVFAASAVAVERMLRTNRLSEALVAANFALAGQASQPPRLVVKGIVAGCGWMARARLLGGHPQRPALDGGALSEWALSFCDDDVLRLRGLGIPSTPSPSVCAAAAPLGETPVGEERALILTATARLASRDGYATLTVPRICATAGVSKRSFEAHFEGMADCFLATLDLLSGRTLAAAEPLFLTADDWASGIHRMVVGLCQHLARDPAFASLVFLDAFSPGSELIQWRSETIARLAATLRRGAPPAQRPTAFAAEASIGAMWGVIHHFVATGRGAQLPQAAPILSYLALAPALGGAAAVDAVLIDRNPVAQTLVSG